MIYTNDIYIRKGRCKERDEGHGRENLRFSYADEADRQIISQSELQ
jgi:hypothetical protein